MQEGRRWRRGGRGARGRAGRAGRALAGCRRLRREQACRATTSTGRPMSPGTRRATSTSPTATATRASRSSTRRQVHQVVGLARHRAGSVQHRRTRIAIDAQGNVYVGDRRQQAHSGLRRRGQLQDAVHQRRRAVGASASRRGRASSSTRSNSNDADVMDNGEIYKMELDGKIVGKFGTAGKLIEGVRHGDTRWTAERERALRRRDHQLARPEADAQAAIAFNSLQFPTSNFQLPTTKNTFGVWELGVGC